MKSSCAIVSTSTMIDAADISGKLQQKFRDQHGVLIARIMPAFIDRLEKNFNNLAYMHILEKDYEGTLTFTAKWDNDKTIILTPSDPDLFRKLEMGEFDKQGNLIKSPHSIIAEWKVQVRIPKKG